MNQDQKSLNKKIVLEYSTLSTIVEGLKAANYKIVLTIGSWDLLHVGHCRYILKAWERGDITIVGVDSDAAIKRYKGEFRPIITQDERMEMLSYLYFVDYITLLEDVDENGQWHCGLLKLLKPHIFVAVEDSYPEEQKRTIKQYCQELVVLPKQAENTSSTEIVQNLLKKHFEAVLKVAKGGSQWRKPS